MYKNDASFAEQKIIIIAGPTATGKTELAIELALSFNAEIINCDSRQIYKYMNIGTAKPTRKQLDTVKHYMIDIIEPSSHFSAADYVILADQCIKDIYNTEHLPFIVGGTGFYIKALLHGLAPIPSIDQTIRDNIRELQKLHGNEALYEMLKKMDPEDAIYIKKNDTYRLIRALEVFISTGKSLYYYTKQHQFSGVKYNYLYIVLYNPNKQQYHTIIDKRVDRMVRDGLVDEVKWLINKGYSSELPAMKTVGYKEMIEYLNNKINFETAVELIKKHTKAYAKRQLTWFKGTKDALWIDINDKMDRIGAVIKRFLYA